MKPTEHSREIAEAWRIWNEEIEDYDWCGEHDCGAEEEQMWKDHEKMIADDTFNQMLNELAQQLLTAACIGGNSKAKRKRLQAADRKNGEALRLLWNYAEKTYGLSEKETNAELMRRTGI